MYCFAEQHDSNMVLPLAMLAAMAADKTQPVPRLSKPCKRGELMLETPVDV